MKSENYEDIEMRLWRLGGCPSLVCLVAELCLKTVLTTSYQIRWILHQPVRKWNRN